MIVHDVDQGSRAWSRLRIGIPTASAFDQLVTPAQLKPAKGYAYLMRLLTEWALGCSIGDESTSQILERGRDNEAWARNAYTWETGKDVTQVGFITTDDGRAGGSPDGLVGDDGGVELKFPMAKTHVSYLIDPQSLVMAYRCQVQGYLWITGREWWDVCSYHRQWRDDLDELPSVRVRCELDPEWVDSFEPALEAFLERLEAAKETLRARGVEAE